VGRAGRIPGRSVCEPDLPEAGTPTNQSQKITVNILKLVYQAFSQPVKQVCLLPQTLAKAARQRQRQTVFNKREVERLDRICNPEKYRGK
jgi:hypothetical protein